MQCPVCKIYLVMSERSGIEIDYCSKCRGVWLDRGELDKVIERSSQASQPVVAEPAPQQHHAPAPMPQSQYDTRRDNYDYGYNSKHHKKKSKADFLGDLFDF